MAQVRIKSNRSDTGGTQKCYQKLPGQAIVGKSKRKAKILFKNQRSPAEPGPFQGTSPCPQLCWWSLICLTNVAADYRHGHEIEGRSNYISGYGLLHRKYSVCPGHSWIVTGSSALFLFGRIDIAVKRNLHLAFYFLCRVGGQYR